MMNVEQSSELRGKIFVLSFVLSSSSAVGKEISFGL